MDKNSSFYLFLNKVLEGQIPALLVLIALTSGLISLNITPREEEPQIVVPMADVYITTPGLVSKQIERQIVTPLEKLLTQIDGVEHVYSVSNNDNAVVTVRFYVGEDREDSLVKIYNKIYSNQDKVPAAVSSWVVKPVEVDDVPILLVALWSSNPQRYSDHELRRVSEELTDKLQVIKNTNRIEITGGRPRQIRVELNPDALAARRTAPLDVAQALKLSNKRQNSGFIQQHDNEIVIESGDFIKSAEDLKHLVINVVDGVPIYLNEVANIIDGPSEPDAYTWIGFGPADQNYNTGYYPAVIISIAKQHGSNAVKVAKDVEEYLQVLKTELLPDDIEYRLIRNYGDTANEKVNDLVNSLIIAIITVLIFIGLFIGWRAALIVGLAIPVCYGATLGLDFLTGYTINRVTLFALILALGLLVDDPITGVDNIERFLNHGNDGNKRDNVIKAMLEIRNALIMSTIAIILAFIPLAFITGMMGPYMAPMAFNVPVAVTISTLVAFLVTPWAAYKFLKNINIQQKNTIESSCLYRMYSWLLEPLVSQRRNAWVFIGFIIILFIMASALPLLRAVPLKLLPYDNKNEFQIVIDMPEGTTLERSQAVTQEVADYLKTLSEVQEVVGFVGLSSPIDFNGMVRHYYLRKGSHVADIRVTLVERQKRVHQSHEIITRIRSDVSQIGNDYGANIKLVEVPPGPPVISTITAEVYGKETSDYKDLQDAANTVADRLKKEKFVVDVDTSIESMQQKWKFITDKEKAALSGIATEDISQTMLLATKGMFSTYLEIPTEANPLPIILRLPLDRRTTLEEFSSLQVKGRAGITKLRDERGVVDAPQPLVPLGELGVFEKSHVETSVYHKDLKRVSYVYAEIAGRPPLDVILDVDADLNNDQAVEFRPLNERTHLNPGSGLKWTLDKDITTVWDGEGEWHITLRVFRDMGLAFAAAMAGIFFVLLIQTGSAKLTIIIMSAIPLTVIGVMPGFWLLNNIGEHTIAGTPNLVLFTATAMIGMIALAGIVIRNSLILVEYINLSISNGLKLKNALLQAGAVRMRPVLLTAGTTMLGNIVITLDPIFSGLAWSIIFGIIASTIFTLLVVPVCYFLVYQKALESKSFGTSA